MKTFRVICINPLGSGAEFTQTIQARDEAAARVIIARKNKYVKIVRVEAA